MYIKYLDYVCFFSDEKILTFFQNNTKLNQMTVGVGSILHKTYTDLMDPDVHQLFKLYVFQLLTFFYFLSVFTTFF